MPSRINRRKVVAMNRIVCVAALVVLVAAPEARASDLKPMQTEELKPGVLCRINTKAKFAGLARERFERYHGRVLAIDETEVVLEGHWFTEYRATQPALEQIPFFGAFYFTRGACLGSPRGKFKIAISEIDAIQHEPPDDRSPPRSLIVPKPSAANSIVVGANPPMPIILDVSPGPPHH